MRLDRLPGLLQVLVCLCFAIAVARAQQPTPAQGTSPFESVPGAAAPSAPQAEPAKPSASPQTPSPFEAPKPTAEAPPPVGAENVIEAIEFRGARRVPVDTLRARIFSKKGDRVDDDALRRDFMALWNTGRFDDIRMELEPGKTGQIVRFVLTERQIVRTITYVGFKSLTVSEILDRFKERKVGLTVESMYDPSKVQRARVVLQEYLAERGRQFAVVEPVLTQIPPSSLAITFRAKEGSKVKVGRIDIQGNSVYGDRALIRSMRNLRPYGIPYSIVAEDIFSKAYDSTKLDMDMDMIRNFYQERGYFTARAIDFKIANRDVGGGKFRFPLLYMNRPGKRADVTVQVEEGRQYFLSKINFAGMKFFKTQDFLTTQVFKMGTGDVFSTAKLRKGIEELQKLYGMYGYIDMVAEPNPELIPNTNKLNLTFNIDEGSQFIVRRIDFSGNTTTRDKVIRRELLLEEGDIYNTHLWDVSILRLNQLGYFEALKEKEAADIRRDPKNNTVDITLKVKERGKNTVGLQGGVSGIAGTFVGFNYSTNNFLGLGETLSLDTQIGDRTRNATLGFTEPYFLDRPISVGFTIYLQRFNFDQLREVSLTSNRDLSSLGAAIGTNNLLNYISNGHGFTTFASYPMKKIPFARVGLTYGFDISNIKVLTPAAQAYFEYINFQQGVGGPNSLSGIRTSKVVPSFTYNTVDHPMTPTRGKSFFVSTEFAGSFLGGNVNMIRPTFSATYYRKGLKPGHVIGMRAMGSFLTGYGGKLAPPFNRFYIGGEQDIRGFDIWGVSPLAYVPSSAQVPVLNDDGTARVQKIVVNGVTQSTTVSQTIPIYQLTQPGGDTQGVGNLEYRIPIVGPVTLAAFFDIGVNKILRPSQLTMNPDRVSTLNGQFPQAGFSGRALIAKGTQNVRSSTGLELQVIMPVVNAPFRIYWAYNPMRANTIIQPPIAADRSFFPNQASYLGAMINSGYGLARPYQDPKKAFRFTIGRTF
jgi:outer membrane protein insertion porin family